MTPRERGIFRQLKSPVAIQDFLDAMPINFEERGETYMSPRRVLLEKKAHCAEGALLAAAALAFYGERPLIMDLRSTARDIDHVVALFKRNGYWGAISKTNHPVLRYRDPIYPDVRSLALSYFHEYFMDDGKKSLVAYSAPFDLSRYAPKKWITASENLDSLIEALDRSRHFPLVPKKNRRAIRNATPFEIRASAKTEWKRKER